MKTSRQQDHRWRDYYIDSNFTGFWRNRLMKSDARVLTLLGVGFDPRCLSAISALSSLRLPDRVGYIALRLVGGPVYGPAAPSAQRLGDANAGRLETYTQCRREAACDVSVQDSEGHNITGWKTLEEVANLKSILESYDDIIVDISGMPRGMFFPLIAYLIRQSDQGHLSNIHVAIVEDATLDSSISGIEFSQADYIHTFRSTDRGKFIWLPVIGSSAASRPEKIYSFIKNWCIEICPILPFPARSLRRPDDILVKHAELLFESFLVSFDNIIFCDERSPFDVYRKVLEVDDYYAQRLAGLSAIGKVTTVLSPLSSKTMSLGVLLAAVERSLPVCHVEPGAYDLRIDETGDIIGSGVGNEPTDVWLTGEPYRV